jgi:tRNA-dihydrouridine synthase
VQNLKLPSPFFTLAPLYDVSDTVFRQVIADCAAPDLFFTEFVNVDGLQSPGRSEILKRLQFSAKEQPIIAQIWGKIPENYHKTAKELVDMGFSGIDINMGCPDKAVIKNGCCSALINDRELAAEIIAATKKGAGNLPVSVKTRLGFNNVDLSWHEFLLKQDIAMLSIHGRTKSQMSKVPADWEMIGKVRELRDKISPTTLIVGNGDVMSRAQGLELASKYKIDGIMIGRGIFNDPYVFSENSQWHSMTIEERISLFKKHIELFHITWGDTRPVQILNKFCKIYINNFDGAKELREKLMSTRSIEELLNLL